MARGKKLIILSASFALIICAYFLISHFASNSDSSSDADSSIPVYSTDQDNIKMLTWTYSDGTFSVVRDTVGGIWYCPDDTSLVIDTSYVSTMLGAVYNVTAKSSFTPSSSLSSYGLDPAVMKVTVTLFDGTEVTFCSGNYNSFTSGYYVSYSGSSNVYIMSNPMISEFSHKITDIQTTDSASSSSSSAN